MCFVWACLVCLPSAALAQRVLASDQRCPSLATLVPIRSGLYLSALKAPQVSLPLAASRREGEALLDFKRALQKLVCRNHQANVYVQFPLSNRIDI